MKIILAFTLLLISSVSFANDYQTDIDNFLESLKEGQFEKAVDDIYLSNPYTSQFADKIAKINEQLQQIPGLLGKPRSFEKIDTYAVGESIVQVTYIGIYDRQPLRFEFQFFKIDDDWRIFSFSFDDDVFTELKELARPRALSLND